jgi:semialdehyde dehydrogenase family protein/ArgJ family protein
VGATGYAGGEVCRLLAGHPDLQLTGVHANASVGRRLGELQPHPLPFADLEVGPRDAASLSGHDVVVLALPHGESAAIAENLSAETLVIDCGADHRLDAINGVTVCRGGGIGDSHELVDLADRRIDIDVDLGAGHARATVWTNDLSIAYVHENSAYSS